jgi:hypothetical protein
MVEDPEMLVFKAILDDKYTIRVVREIPYYGKLTIEQNDSVLYSETVPLAYDALFGPHMDDVEEWQVKAIKFVDKV